jgi:hypothetical protein
MRVASDFWVSAILRRCSLAAIPAVCERKGEASAGAVFILIDRLDGTGTLFGPAPRIDASERRLARAHAAEALPMPSLQDRLLREIANDPDCWVLTIEARDGERHRETLSILPIEGA